MPIQVAARYCSKDIVELLVLENKTYQLLQLKDEKNCYLITTAMFNYKLQPKIHKSKVMKETLDSEIENYNKPTLKHTIMETIYGDLETITKNKKDEDSILKLKKNIYNLLIELREHKRKPNVVLGHKPDPKDKNKQISQYDPNFVPFTSSNKIDNKSEIDK